MRLPVQTRRIGLALLSLALMVLLFGWLSGQRDPENHVHIVATATTGGTFYPVGVAIATLTKQVLEEEHGVALAAISSAGSEENLRLMRSGEASFAILQGLYGAWAWRGEGRLEAQEPFAELRSVTALWPNVEHFLIRRSLAPTGTMDDLGQLAGRRFSIGARYSGTEGSNRHILGALGMDPDAEFHLVYQGYGASADAFQNQLIDGMNTPAGVPVGAVTRAMAAARGEGVLLSFEPSHRDAVNRNYPELWQFFEIEAGTYPHQDEAVRTIAQSNLLAVTAEVPDAHVYKLLVALYDNLGFLHAFHAATRSMSLEAALDGLPVPLHPGAVRFYRERGIDIPEPLLPPEERAE
ncbi:TAXI family TRAP transporter solute-binding subunit [Wenzhouxiangella sp. AB-CW3]|uniref:TAXI family TRAP transporter solute-binding subunit n=1 Tax=Wenzhouxiangella sp. AB-CW3 TaxID=2771012 RepID=UPI00168AF850|nr:TAXI family TRAP transporter solute-binding subunit [Wenzhouxiangella sp. AB-CW3]QOC21358.1 TAXI family TRAP transporter solute-binding subunit [Wenzhouxiangella sp. AB-CW3]